jgi:hypothetical protein
MRCSSEQRGLDREVGQAHNPGETPVAHETVISAETAEHAETAEKKVLSRKQDVTGLHCGGRPVIRERPHRVRDTSGGLLGATRIHAIRVHATR